MRNVFQVRGGHSQYKHEVCLPGKGVIHNTSMRNVFQVRGHSQYKHEEYLSGKGVIHNTSMRNVFWVRGSFTIQA